MSVDDIIARIPGRALAWTAMAYNYVTSTYTKWVQFWKNLVKAYSVIARPHYYVFFEGVSHTAHSIYDVVCWASGSAAPEMLYCADSKVFVPWIPGGLANISTILSENASKPLSFLSMEIVEPKTERVIYDLTDFIEEMRVIELEGLPGPTINHILAAWTLSSGVVPDYSKYMVRYVDTNGDVYPAEAPTEEAANEITDLSGASVSTAESSGLSEASENTDLSGASVAAAPV